MDNVLTLILIVLGGLFIFCMLFRCYMKLKKSDSFDINFGFCRITKNNDVIVV